MMRLIHQKQKGAKNSKRPQNQKREASGRRSLFPLSIGEAQEPVSFGE
jgi:hypothetical protein